MKKKLPIGISTFKDIRGENYIYIDKTKEALSLIENGKYYFLSRPRRFGKSLFLDTLKEIFKGNKKLFEGLYIYDKYDWSQKFPVIKISMGGSRSKEDLINNLLDNLKVAQEELQIECEEKKDYAICFKELIRNAHKKYNQKVVVLIDEYDKPILDNIDQVEVAKENREILKRFYTVIKDSDEFIKFAFLTGVSKFSKVSIFSGLNNLEDISLDRRYATICGYTQNDIESSFAPLLKGVDLEKLKEWYNGYNFLGESVYNPFDILLFISKGFLFRNYWFSTGTPTFLIKMLSKKPYNIAELENLVANETLINSFDIENLKVEPLLFQSGYLTIDRVEVTEFEELMFYLRVPNKEVQISFNSLLIQYFTDDDSYFLKRQKLYRALDKIDIDEFKEVLISIYASIPYNSYSNTPLANYEGYYSNIFYVYIASLGLKIVAEDVTNIGRIDFTLFIKDKIYIFEFKVGDKALNQIKQRKYYEKYLNQNKDIILVGINFDKEQKNIKSVEWDHILNSSPK
ncbi:MAG: ATP-binding protein [Epsilonproteobacteria bacterium]|nr:ATP-binding protein [Campylobacterota bacterium]